MLLEVCVDSLAGLRAALAGGADRIELCSALAAGGLTPSPGLMQAAAGCGRPVFAMIRPQAGGFDLCPGDLAVMCADIAAARAAGLQGVVLGATRGDGLDVEALTRLAAAAGGMGLTLHRAFDLCADWRLAVDQAVACGFQRILTSGQAASAPLGAARLADVMAHAAGRIVIMPGGGISATTLPALRHLPLTEVHASCGRPGAPAPFGFGAAHQTDAARVAALKAALAG